MWLHTMSAQGAAPSVCSDFNSNNISQTQVFVQQPESQLTCTVISQGSQVSNNISQAVVLVQQAEYFLIYTVFYQLVYC